MSSRRGKGQLCRPMADLRLTMAFACLPDMMGDNHIDKLIISCDRVIYEMACNHAIVRVLTPKSNSTNEAMLPVRMLS